ARQRHGRHAPARRPCPPPPDGAAPRRLPADLYAVVLAAAADDKPLPPAGAAKKVNEKVTVEREVKSTGGTTARSLNPAADYKGDKNFTVFIPKEALEKFAKAKIEDPAAHYKGKTVRASGTVTLYQAKPQIKVKNPDRTTTTD